MDRFRRLRQRWSRLVGGTLLANFALINLVSAVAAPVLVGLVFAVGSGAYVATNLLLGGGSSSGVSNLALLQALSLPVGVVAALKVVQLTGERLNAISKKISRIIGAPNNSSGFQELERSLLGNSRGASLGRNVFIVGVASLVASLSAFIGITGELDQGTRWFTTAVMLSAFGSSIENYRVLHQFKKRMERTESTAVTSLEHRSALALDTMLPSFEDCLAVLRPLGLGPDVAKMEIEHLAEVIIGLEQLSALVRNPAELQSHLNTLGEAGYELQNVPAVVDRPRSLEALAAARSLMSTWASTGEPPQPLQIVGFHVELVDVLKSIRDGLAPHAGDDRVDAALAQFHEGAWLRTWVETTDDSPAEEESNGGGNDGSSSGGPFGSPPMARQSLAQPSVRTTTPVLGGLTSSERVRR